MKVTRSVPGVAALLVLCLAGLTGCGDSGSADDSPSDSTSQSPGGGAPSMDPSQADAIQECLDAAGIDTQFPGGAPSDMPTDMPSDMPTDVPSGGANGGGMLNDQEIQAALEACGIDLPAAPGGQQ